MSLAQVYKTVTWPPGHGVCACSQLHSTASRLMTGSAKRGRPNKDATRKRWPVLLRPFFPIRPRGPRGWGREEEACQELQEQVPAFSLDPVS